MISKWISINEQKGTKYVLLNDIKIGFVRLTLTKHENKINKNFFDKISNRDTMKIVDYHECNKNCCLAKLFTVLLWL